MEAENVTLYYREGASDKTYQASLEQKNGGFVVNFAFGRRGATLQTGTKTASPVPYEKAKAIFDTLVREKTGKGYTPGPDGTPYSHTDNEEKDTGVRCQLLNPVDEKEAARLVDDPAYWMQEKFDGRRILLRAEAGKTTGINRKGLAVGLPESIVSAAKALGQPCLLDGECVGDTLHAFDLLELDGADQRPLPYGQRLKQLAALLAANRAKSISLVETAMAPANKRILFEKLKKDQHEGVVFKHSAAPYTPGRPASGGSQLKHKFYATASLIVAKVNDKRSVALELYANKKERVEAGNVTIPPNLPVPKEGAVVEVRYLYAYKESGRLYQPTFLGERDDIEASACTTAQLKYRTPSEDDEA